jgi:hypothetical protein
MENITVTYCFTLADGSKRNFDLKLGGEHFGLIQNALDPLPQWTELDFHQCPHCPLKITDSPHCPLSVSIADIVNRFDDIISFEQIHLDVITHERVISQDMSAQRGLSSLLGLVIATSGCPHTAFFKPMARFHLPLANKEETLYRATSMYLLAQYFLKKNGGNGRLELEGLSQIYNDLQVLNTAVSQRLKSVTKTDVSLNAIIILDVYTNTLPRSIEKSLKEIEYLFSAFFNRKQPADA